ncbi:MAG TPA: hypothetical protein VMG38_08310 [Trebonia sp.]|nr:hypothetical protein [Trebonia sp.]
MTAPEDGLEEELRRALDAAASQVEPHDSGLERILARTGRMPPRSWLAGTAAEAFQRVRYWTWRGHWAWQDPAYWRSGEWRSARLAARATAIERRAAAWWARAWRPGMRGWLIAGAASPASQSVTRLRGLRWMRLLAGLAAAAAVTAVTAAVPPLRAAFVEVGSTVLTQGAQALTPSFGTGPGPTGGRNQGTGAVSGASASTGSGTRPASVPSSSATGTGIAVAPAPCLSRPPVAPTAVTSGSADGGRSTPIPSASETLAPQGVATGRTSTGSGGRAQGGCPTTPAGAKAKPSASVPASPAPTSATPTPTPASSTAPASTSTPTPTASPSDSGSGSTTSPGSSGTVDSGNAGSDSGNPQQQPAPTTESTPADSASAG